MIHGRDTFSTQKAICAVLPEHYQKDYHIIIPIMPGHNPKKQEKFFSFLQTSRELEDYYISRYGKSVYAIYGMSMGGVLTATLWQNGQLEIEK